MQLVNYLSRNLAAAAQVAEGLAAIHARDMAHGCFGPERVLLTAAPGISHGFRARVTDYGLAPPAGGPAPTQARRMAAGSGQCRPAAGGLGGLRRAALERGARSSDTEQTHWLPRGKSCACTTTWPGDAGV